MYRVDGKVMTRYRVGKVEMMNIEMNSECRVDALPDTTISLILLHTREVTVM
ncbi:hypothetical protein PWJ_gp03 [Pseudomonas phage PWJ]|nr:hypothetical protein PWJ_gp03 [Pseudomonas phage PWJ]